MQLMISCGRFLTADNGDDVLMTEQWDLMTQMTLMTNHIHTLMTGIKLVTGVNN